MTIAVIQERNNRKNLIRKVEENIKDEESSS